MMTMNIIRIISGLLHFDRTNWKAVSLCVLAAAVFWLFNAFNKSHSANIDFPLTFEFNRERFTPTQPLPTKIRLNVSGNGWDLFTKSFGFKVHHLQIPLDRQAETKKIIGSSLLPAFSHQMGNLHINFIVTDTLHINLDNRDQHSYKLVADLSKVTFEKGYGRVSPVVILPDSVLVDGPKSILHRLADSIALHISEEKLNSNFKTEVEIEIPEKNLMAISPAKAKIIFEVGRVEEITKTFALEGAARGDSLSVTFQIPADKVLLFHSDAKEIIAAHHKSSFHFSHLPAYAIVMRTSTETGNQK
jgi:hypothetical protein